uniref:Uncharacterized protein n=1 Tax=Candidatus Kentrum sp. FM TaxID=2126340 RepID=A0A450SAU1_9GAMM|nr:MAG: hypothetical protein BECKFM1743C_GA0114222_100265 [Candidatus Kentron sp. FM]VFJ49211.1 MAG: hypothetical protein BECKFM1743A_GA0114220_100685 [Candidatus Kentron sp. FM]VFK10024.1 MAG: hypothetical protein BECKFM1743B_GA0114221_101265 [Candidatus Kentron sp. FM]
MNNWSARIQSRFDSVIGLKSNLKRAMSLHQYGDSMMTPAVRAWLGSVWVIIFLMSLIEAVVWFFVSQYFVAESVRWVGVFLAPLFFFGIFVLIWVIDVSFITAERPLGIKGVDNPPPDEFTDDTGADHATESGDSRLLGRLSGHFHMGEQVRWWFGIAVRLAIVLISIAITAPFLAQTIRSDEIANKYQAMLDEARRDKEAELVELQDAEIARLRKRREELMREQEHLRAERELLIRDSDAAIEEARKRTDDYYQEYLAEIEGRDGRTPGRGPRAKAAMEGRDEAKAYTEQLVEGKREKLERIELRSRKLTEELDWIDGERLEKENQRAKAQAVFRPMDFSTFAEEYDLEVPADTVGARVRLLAELRAEDLAAFDPKNEYEKWAFHFSSVEGLSQALLGILFLAMLALKLFEPRAVKLYFNEELQHQWRRYQNGGFNREPGFVSSTEPNAYNHFDFAHAYLSFRAAPELFWRQQEKLADEKIKFDEMKLNGKEREQRYQEEVLKSRVESNRKLREIVRKTELETARKYTEKEWRIKSEKLDYELDQQKQDIDNKYRELNQQYQAETEEIRKELESKRTINLDALKRKNQEEKERFRMEKDKRRIENEHLSRQTEDLKQQTEILKRNQKLREQARAKFLDIMEERRKIMEERRKIQEARRKGEEEKNESEKERARHQFEQENRQRQRSIFENRIARYAGNRKKIQEQIDSIDTRINEIREAFQKTSHKLDDTERRIRKETDEQKRAASDKTSSWKRYAELMRNSPDDESLLNDHFDTFKYHQDRESRLQDSLDKLKADRDQLKRQRDDTAREQKELEQKRVPFSQELVECKAEIEQAEEQLSRLG